MPKYIKNLGKETSRNLNVIFPIGHQRNYQPFDESAFKNYMRVSASKADTTQQTAYWRYCIFSLIKPLNGDRNIRIRRTALKNSKKKAVMAKDFLRKDTRINIRISTGDLDRIKRIAAYEGLSYQTLIASLLHKYAVGHLCE